MPARSRLAPILSAAAVLVANLLTSNASAQQNPGAASCVVSILSPAEGAAVGPEEAVKGKAIIPAGSYLWVFVHPKGLANWWPQGVGAAALTDDGSWGVVATFGGAKDVGRDFEVAAFPVDAAANASLDGWFQRAKSTGQYPSIPLPEPMAGCPVKSSVVRKGS